jgi:carbon storage regulator CsrA
MALIIGRTPQRNAEAPLGQVWIGDNICVSVVDSGGRIRLHVEAPRDVPILRGEIKEKQKEEPRNDSQ